MIAKVNRKYRSNGTVLGSDVKDGGAVSAIIWQQELGGNRGYFQVPGDVPPSGGTMYHRGDSKTRGRRRVGVPIGRGGD